MQKLGNKGKKMQRVMARKFSMARRTFLTCSKISKPLYVQRSLKIKMVSSWRSKQKKIYENSGQKRSVHFHERLGVGNYVLEMRDFAIFVAAPMDNFHLVW